MSSPKLPSYALSYIDAQSAWDEHEAAVESATQQWHRILLAFTVATNPATTRRLVRAMAGFRDQGQMHPWSEAKS